jgi:hypothetical protein
MRYDPARAPDPVVWLQLDQFERIDAALEHHRKRLEDWHPEVGNIRLHAVIHAIVENQVASGDPPEVAATLVRLVEEGLERHDAIHAVGSVEIGEIQEMLEDERIYDRVAMVARLDRLSARTWRVS